jgi:ribosomal protein S18 acetylase RimI-like enzyme
MKPRIVRVRELRPDQIGELVTESEQAGLRLVRRLSDDWISGGNRFERTGEALFAAVRAHRIVGVCGLNIDPYSTSVDVGRVRHLYVLIASRKQGIGSRLVIEVTAAARGTFNRLQLRTDDPTAAGLYERHGFRRCETDPSATHVLDLR